MFVVFSLVCFSFNVLFLYAILFFLYPCLYYNEKEKGLGERVGKRKRTLEELGRTITRICYMKKASFNFFKR